MADEEEEKCGAVNTRQGWVCDLNSGHGTPIHKARVAPGEEDYWTWTDYTQDWGYEESS